MINDLTASQVEIIEDCLRYKVSELKTEIVETKQDGWKNEFLVENLEEKLKEAQTLLKVLTNARLEKFAKGEK